MAYSELVKNFEKVRAYMREFYLYGFKSRNDYSGKSARSYDDERRRIESWLGDYMRFSQTAEGKSVFLSVDSRISSHNPFYKAWKAKSFTDGDITLHFILFDILHSPDIQLTISELMEQIDEYLSCFDEPMTFDESTVRKKLKEYTAEGIIHTEKNGRKVLYSRTENTNISDLYDVLEFFSEAAPCGVIGSFLLDKSEPKKSIFSFKHHYITGAIDSDVMAELFSAIREHRFVTIESCGRKYNAPRSSRIVPLKIYISTQNGRQNLIAYHAETKQLGSYRLDYITDVKTGDVCPEFDDLRQKLTDAEQHTWGVNCRMSSKNLDHVEFIVEVLENEQHIVQRLEREKRCGTVEQVDETHYRFSADVFDCRELLPWIRTFICRITQLDFSDRTIENLFREDIEEMYRMYGIEEGEEQ